MSGPSTRGAPFTVIPTCGSVMSNMAGISALLAEREPGRRRGTHVDDLRQQRRRHSRDGAGDLFAQPAPDGRLRPVALRDRRPHDGQEIPGCRAAPPRRSPPGAWPSRLERRVRPLVRDDDRQARTQSSRLRMASCSPIERAPSRTSACEHVRRSPNPATFLASASDDTAAAGDRPSRERASGPPRGTSGSALTRITSGAIHPLQQGRPMSRRSFAEADPRIRWS